jgi:hypothetical protein
MRTVRRNSNEAKDVIALSEKVTVYSLENGFRGEVVNSDALAGCRAWIWKLYLETKLGKMRQTDRKRYTVTIHSNLWYEIETYRKVR